MKRDQIRLLLDQVCEFARDAVDHYCQNSDEKTDEIPEFVMSMGVARSLAAIGKTVILEANSKIIRRRLGTGYDNNCLTLIEKFTQNLKRGRVDLVIFSDDQDRTKRKPIGFIEFKKWKHDQRSCPTPWCRSCG